MARPQAGMTSAAALARAGMIIGISQIMGLVSAPVFGVLSDKMGGSRAVVLSTGLTAVVFAATLLISNPLSGVDGRDGTLFGICSNQ